MRPEQTGSKFVLTFEIVKKDSCITIFAFIRRQTVQKFPGKPPARPRQAPGKPRVFPASPKKTSIFTWKKQRSSRQAPPPSTPYIILKGEAALRWWGFRAERERAAQVKLTSAYSRVLQHLTLNSNETSLQELLVISSIESYVSFSRILQSRGGLS